MAKRTARAGGTSRPGRLRIVAGIWRSRLLAIADVPGLRPTSERIRETVFNWLAPRLPGARCLDLFAGTGALGLEALSRGAASTVFVEASAIAARTLRENIASLAAENATLVQGDALDYLRSSRDGPFDIVFLDPPFAADRLAELCRLLDAGSLLADRACVYIEEDRGRPASALPAGWLTGRTRATGNVRFSLAEVGDRAQGGN